MRPTRILLSILITLSLHAQDYSGGSGTSEDPYHIASKADLKYLSENSAEASKHFIQTADIAFTASDFEEGGDFYNGGEGFISIGNPNFTGSYDGDGYTIDSLTINTSHVYTGLFARLSGATVQDLGLTNVTISYGYYNYVGALAGYATLSSTVTNCYSSGSVEAFDFLGGLLGFIDNNCAVSNCYSTADVGLSNTAGDNRGGLSGYLDSGAEVSDCHAGGDVAGYQLIGGLIGSIYNDATVENSYADGTVNGTTLAGGFTGQNNGTVNNSYAAGPVTVATIYGGGFAGKNNGTVYNCYAGGNVTGTDPVSSDIGGLLGFNVGTVTDCFARGDVSGGQNIGGFLGNITGGVVKRSYSTGAVSGSRYVGGLIGNGNPAYTENSFWNMTTSSQTVSNGGTGITTTDMQDISTYAGWHIASGTNTEYVWNIVSGENDGFPKHSGLTLYVDNIRYSGGDGTEAHPYKIATKADLKYFSENNTDFEKYFLQTADIQFTATDFESDGDFYNSGRGFLPFGEGAEFKGSYDGNGHTIDSIYQNPASGAGLFETLRGAAVKNLGITNVRIIGNYGYIGALAGTSTYGSTVTNCYSTGQVDGSINVGGLIGYNNFSTVSECYSTVAIDLADSSADNCGGLIGFNNNSSTVTESYATGPVAGDQSVGGLLGYNSSSNVSDSYARNSVAGNMEVGGLIGRNTSSGTVQRSYSRGSVSGTTNTGGLLGLNDATVNADCFWDTETSGQNSSAGGTGKTTAEMKGVTAGNSFTDWGWSTSIWQRDGQSYPMLIDNPETRPDLQSRNIVFSSLRSSQMTLNWSIGNGAYRVVFAKAAGTGSTAPVDNSSYTANAAFGSGTEISSAWYCIYNGSGSNVTVTNLSPGTDYIFQIFDYVSIGGNILYLTSTATDNPKTQASPTIPTAPVTQTTEIAGTDIQLYQMTLGWTSGNGAYRAVFAKEGRTGSTSPVNNTVYAANTVFGSGSELDGVWYCVYNGAGSEVTVTGFKIGTEYIFQAFEYNGYPGEIAYNAATAANNPKVLQTLTSGKMVYSYTGSEQTWTVPAGISQVSVKVWGAGGAGATYQGTSGAGGGAGGYTEATLNVTAGQQLIIIVGGGGEHGIAGGSGGLGGWPGGGYGTAGDASGGGGGGYSGLFLTSHAHENALLIAGGGGGGTGYRYGGGGGGENGIAGDGSGGNGGTQTAGGTGTQGADGSALQGGNGDSLGTRESGSVYDGGGGGGGYYGGEGGYSDAGGGGGGSGFLHADLASGTFESGIVGINADVGTAPHSSDEDYVSGVAVGSLNDSDAGNGLVVISFFNDSSLPVTLSSFTAESANDGVQLNWSTSAEIENAGFILYRQLSSDPNSRILLADYRSHDALKGQGTTSDEHIYSFIDATVSPGISYIYNLSDMDFSGKETHQSEVEITTESENTIIADAYTLRPAYPNPFNPVINLPFTLNESLPVTITLYSINGRKVKTIMDKTLDPGTHTITSNVSGLSSGVYFLQIQMQKQHHSQKILLLK